MASSIWVYLGESRSPRVEFPEIIVHLVTHIFAGESVLYDWRGEGVLMILHAVVVNPLTLHPYDVRTEHAGFSPNQGRFCGSRRHNSAYSGTTALHASNVKRDNTSFPVLKYA